jgi:hypothetical protein
MLRLITIFVFGYLINTVDGLIDCLNSVAHRYHQIGRTVAYDSLWSDEWMPDYFMQISESIQGRLLSVWDDIIVLSEWWK